MRTKRPARRGETLWPRVLRSRNIVCSVRVLYDVIWIREKKQDNKRRQGAKKMKILAFLRNHAHYWGIPHTRTSDNRLIQTCYECGAERQMTIELRPSPFVNIDAPIHEDHLAA